MGTLMCSYIFDNKLTRLRNAIIRADLEEVKVELKSFKSASTNGNSSGASFSRAQEEIYLSDLINGQIDTEGNTPLLFSIKMLQFESFKSLLLELKADPNTKNFYTDYAPLHLCAVANKMTPGEHLNSEKNKKKVSDISMFTMNTQTNGERNERSVSMNDAFPTAKSSFESLPYGSVDYVPSVNQARRVRRPFDHQMLRDMIRLLVENGANVDLEAKVTKQTQIVLETVEHVTPLFLAIYHSNIVACDELIQLGSNLNYQEKSSKMTPLHLACYLSKKEICYMLLSKSSIKIDLKSSDGNGCMHWLALNDKDDIGILQLFVRHFRSSANETDLIAFINDKNDKLQTPLMLASMQNKINCVKFLLDNGASIDFQDKHGQNALAYAKQNSCLQLLETYLKLKRTQSNKRTIESLDSKSTEDKMHNSATF
jgi:ankyrin repeat protein